MKKILLGILLGIVVAGGTVYAANQYFANDINFSSTKTSKTNVKDALDELYELYGSPSLVHTETGLGNKDFAYTFEDEIKLGLIVITAHNNTINTDYVVADIQNMTAGEFEELSDKAHSFLDGTQTGARSKIYLIKNVPADAVVNMHGRWGIIYQIIKLY